MTLVRLEPAALRSRVKHSTTEPLRSLKSNDKLLIANVSNYFEKHSGWDSSSYSDNWGQQKNRFPSTKRTMRDRYTFVPATFETGTIQTSGGHIDEVVIRNNVQEFYTHHHPLPTINNLLSVLKMISC